VLFLSTITLHIYRRIVEPLPSPPLPLRGKGKGERGKGKGGIPIYDRSRKMAAHLSTPIVDRGDRPSISDGGLFKIQIESKN